MFQKNITMTSSQITVNVITLPYIPTDYRDILTMPKLMVSGAMDEFFMPDDYDYFYDDLLGEKYMWWVLTDI
jgi:PhoPQ-activated pathogenicity-related protein